MFIAKHFCLRKPLFICSSFHPILKCLLQRWLKFGSNFSKISFVEETNVKNVQFLAKKIHTTIRW